jgi:hypothetical protein
MSASYFVSNWERKATETFKILKVTFGEQKMGITQFLSVFFKFKSDVTFAENAKFSGYPLISKTDENME